MRFLTEPEPGRRCGTTGSMQRAPGGARAAEPYGRRGGEEEDVATGQRRDGGAEPALGRTFEDARLMYAMMRYVSVWYAVPVDERARF